MLYYLRNLEINLVFLRLNDTLTIIIPTNKSFLFTMNKNNTHFFHLQNLKKNTNDYYDILINIYLIVDRKKNTTLIVFAMDAPFSRYPNMSLPARIHDRTATVRHVFTGSVRPPKNRKMNLIFIKIHP